MASYSTFHGADQVMANLRKLKAFAPDAFAVALYQETQIEVTECKNVTPVDTGALRASIHPEGPFREGRRIWANIVAGDASIDYAIIVHEDPDADHSHSHNSNGQWKYIQQPLEASAPYLGDRIAKRIDLNKAL